jgi:hypothetical protein
MNNTQENYYRVIKPYESNILHVSSNLMGGASKCYKEFKKVSPNSSSFSIMHMKSNQIYDFNVNNSMTGGMLPNTDIKKLEIKLDSLEKRIVDLENKVNLGNMEIKKENNPVVSEQNKEQIIGGVLTEFNSNFVKKFI